LIYIAHRRETSDALTTVLVDFLYHEARIRNVFDFFKVFFKLTFFITKMI